MEPENDHEKPAQPQKRYMNLNDSCATCRILLQGIKVFGVPSDWPMELRLRKEPGYGVSLELNTWPGGNPKAVLFHCTPGKSSVMLTS